MHFHLAFHFTLIINLLPIVCIASHLNYSCLLRSVEDANHVMVDTASMLFTLSHVLIALRLLL